MVDAAGHGKACEEDASKFQQNEVTLKNVPIYNHLSLPFTAKSDQPQFLTGNNFMAFDNLATSLIHLLLKG